MFVVLTGCGGGGEDPKFAPPPFDWASLDGGGVQSAVGRDAGDGLRDGGGASADGGDAAVNASGVAVRLAALEKVGIAIAGEDPAPFAALYAADAVVVIPGISEWTGGADIGAMHDRVFHAFSGVKYAASRILMSRNGVACVEWVLTGTQTKTW